jgi:hypothetical protein
MNTDWIPETQILLQNLTQSAIRPFFSVELGSILDESGMSAVVTAADSKAILRQVRKDLAPDLVAFIGMAVKWDKDERNRMVECVIGPGSSQFDILRLARSRADRYHLGTEELILRLQEYHRRLGIDIFRAETDVVEFDLLSLPENVSGFTRDLYQFCPVLVDQGLGSLDALQEYILSNRRVYLWWD